MKRRALITLFVLTAILLMVSPVFAYIYRATYTVTSENTTDFEMLGVYTDNVIANQWMADNGFFNSTANDTRIETLGGLEKPHMITDNATFTAIPVPAGSQTNLYFTTGNSEEDFDIIPGYDGYVTVADNTTIELGDNFTISQSGWVDTTPTVAPNITNADFELDSDWTTGAGTTVQSNSQAHSGNFSWRASTSSWGYQDLSWLLAYQEVEFTLTGWVYGHADSNARWGLNDGVSTTYSDDYGTEAWAEKTITKTLADNATRLRVILDNNDVGSVAYFDDVSIEMFANNLVRKKDAIRVYVSGSGNITAQIYSSSANVTATGVASGEHIVKTDEQPVLSLDGANDWIQFPTNNAYKIDATSGTGMTFMFWGDIVAPNSGALSQHVIVGKELGNTYANGVNIHNTTGIVQVAHVSTTGATIDVDDFTGWHLYTFLFSTDMETSTIYVDTSLESEVDSGVAFTWNTANDLHIGNNFADRTCEGLFGEVWFYNRILDPSGIEDVYNGVTSSTGLVGYWKLSDGAGTKAKDFSVTANDGTITGASWGNEFLRIYVDDVLEDLDDGAAVSDNTSDWVFMQNNVMPYSDNTSLEVDGVLELWFRPNDIISGTTLPDRADIVANDGTFTFGANPQGVAVIMGGLVSEAQPSPGETVDDPPPDIMPGVEVTDWYIEPDVTGALLTNPMRPFVTIMSDTTTLTELQAWRLLGTALVLMVAVGTIRAVRGHLGIASMATGAIILGMVVWTIYPMWALVLAVVMFIAGLIAERSPSL